MKIVGIDTVRGIGENDKGVEILARFIDADGHEMTACISDYDAWYGCVGYGFMTADSDPCEETVCEFHNKGEAVASEYGKVFDIMAAVADTLIESRKG